LNPGDRIQMGLRDLTHPTPKRTQLFLTIFQNFYLFYSNIYTELVKVS
jgi:hypothetical protein